MKLFPYAHATHPHWSMGVGLVLAQLRAQMSQPQYASEPALGVLYLTDAYTHAAQDILDALGNELPHVTDWVGTVGRAICTNNAEYIDEPALAVMLCDLSPEQYRVFSGVSPLSAAHGALGFSAHTALIHVGEQTTDTAELIAEVAQRTTSGQLFGGITSGRGASVQFARSSHGSIAGLGLSGAAGVFQGGLSGVAFAASVPLLTRLTQGVRPLTQPRRIERVDSNVVLELDGRDALDVLLDDLGITLNEPREAVEVLRRTLVGLAQPSGLEPARASLPQGVAALGDEVCVRHLLGLDPGRRGFAVADTVPQGGWLTFCERQPQAARADLRRICAELREALEPEELSFEALTAMNGDPAASAPHPARRVAGALYVSCTARGGAYFGGPSAEMQIVRQALGDVPLVGFFANGEIAHHRLYTYAGVLTLFLTD